MKICQLLFEIRHPIDSIDQFRKHIDIFRIKTGTPELAFEHSAWLSKQFQVMGELFEEAIANGYLSAVQTQHPGFYFHSAANHSIQRRLNCKDLTRSSPSRTWTPENPSPIEHLDNLEFYGQRPWRQGQQGMEILDQQKERDGIVCLQELELSVNLTPLITDLFKKAIVHFKRFNCERMKQYLMVCMAEEHLFAREYQESLNNYVKVLNDYSNEHWWPILTSIMSNAIKCAYYVADITNYCLLSIELMGKNILLPDEEKLMIQRNLIKVLSNEIPNGEYHNIENTNEALVNWKSEYAKLEKADSIQNQQQQQQSQNDKTLALVAHKIIPAHVTSMVPFVECKISFGAPIFNTNQYCELFVFVRVNCVESIQFSKLYIRFNLANYNQYCAVDDPKELIFEPNVTRHFKFKFLAQKQDCGKDLEINSISLELGDRDVRVLVLHWKGDCKNALALETNTLNSFANLSSASSPHKVFDDKDKNLIHWDSILNSPSAKIISRKAKIELKLEHKMPIFVDEYYAIKLTVENQEDKAIEDLSLVVELLSNSHETTNSSNATKKPYRLWIGDETLENKSLMQTSQTKNLGTIESKQQLIETIYVQMSEIMSANLVIQINYDGDYVYKQFSNLGNLNGKNDLIVEKKQLTKCTCIQEDSLRLDSMNAFRFDFRFLSMQMKSIKSVRLGEPFVVLCEIKNETPYSIKFKNSSLEPITNVVCKSSAQEDGERIESFLKNETLRDREMANECFCLTVNDLGSMLTSLGDYNVEWRRNNILADEANCSDLETDDQVTNESSSCNDDQNEKKDNIDRFYVKTRAKLPEIHIESFPFLIETCLPTYGFLEQNMTITYKIRNKTQSQILDLECNLDENEFFSIGGNKLETMQIMPNDSTDYSYVVYPLQAGYCRLPPFHIRLSNPKVNNNMTDSGQAQPSAHPSIMNDWSNLDAVIQNMIPSQIYIMPEKKVNIE